MIYIHIVSLFQPMLLLKTQNVSILPTKCLQCVLGTANIDTFLSLTWYQSVFRSCSAAFWHGGDLHNFFARGIPLTSRIGEHKGRIDLMSEKIVLGMCRCLSRARQLGSVSKTSNQKRCLFSHACPCSQQSLSSQQLFQWGRWALPTLHLRAVNKLCWGVLMMSVWGTK